MKLSQEVSPSVSPKKFKAKKSAQWEEVWHQIKLAEEKANREAANTQPRDRSLRKRSSEIMISSAEEDTALDSSYMKWLGPKASEAIKQKIMAEIKERSQATKNLNLA